MRQITRIASLVYAMFKYAESKYENLEMAYPGIDEEVHAFMEIYEDKAGVQADPDAIVKVINRGYRAKQSIWRALNLPSDGRLWLNMADPSELRQSKVFSETTDLLSAMGVGDPGNSAMESLTSGLWQNRTKFTRYLAREAPKHPQAVDVLQKAGYASVVQFVSELGKQIEVLKKPMLISANPLDILLASNECTWNSCHAIEGLTNQNTNYYSGTVAYAISDNTLMIANTDSRRPSYPFFKKGRQWLYFDKSLKSLAFGQAYGNIPTELQDQIGKDVGGRISQSLGIPNGWETQTGQFNTKDKYPDDKIHGGDQIYFDSHKIPKVMWHESIPANSMAEGAPELHFPDDTPCLSCADDHSEQEHGTCSSCAPGGRYTCNSCNTRLDENETLVADNETYCEECFYEKYTTCERCGDPTEMDEIIRIGEMYYCEYCRDRVAEQCSICDGWVLNSAANVGHDSSCNTEYFCDDCLDNTFNCDECDALHRDPEHNSAIKHGEGVSVCDDCMSSYTRCTPCANFYYSDEIGPEGFCPECSQEYDRCTHCNLIYANEDLKYGFCARCQPNTLLTHANRRKRR